MNRFAVRLIQWDTKAVSLLLVGVFFFISLFLFHMPVRLMAIMQVRTIFVPISQSVQRY